MNMTRREFLKGTAALVAAGLFSQRPASGAPTWAHRIVRSHHPLASYFDVLNFEFQERVPESYYGNFVNGEIVNRMFDDALCALAGEPDPAAALRKLVPYRPGERVFIKINTTTSYQLWSGSWETINWDLHYNDMDALAEPINATLRALVRVGVPEEMIALTDASWSEGDSNPEQRIPRLVPNRVARKIKAKYPGVALYRSSFVPGGDGLTWGSNDAHAIVEFRNPVINARKTRATSHRLPDQVIRADHVISIPIMKRHGEAGVTGAFKNNFGTIASCRDFHKAPNEDRSKPSALFSRAAHPAVDIWLNPHVGPKTRLIVCDGLLAGWDWGQNPPVGWKQFGGRSPNCLLLGTDPVAMDSVVFDHVTESLPDKVKGFPGPNMLVDAAQLGLGVYESRSSPNAGYRSIDYLELEQKADPAKLRKLAELSARYKAGGKTRSEISDLIAECRAQL
jgi:Domain of unknown function (DUF362)/TAT (twin-arginine translocation) pathway signal sequence